MYEEEAGRFASCHMRFHAPGGFLIRNIRLGTEEEDQRELTELSSEDAHCVVQGVDQNLAHVHLARENNPRRVYLNVALGLRGGLTTLWMLATVLTAVLLWLVHHHPSFGEPVLQNKQITAAALLVGPAFASAWSLRAEAGELLRTSLAGARVLLLGSAALSVATALALADFLPFGANRYDTISFYAAASYLIAFVLTTAWLVSSWPTWFVFRRVLGSERRCLLLLLLLGVMATIIGHSPGLPIRLTGGLLLLIALVIAALTANMVA
jgi:hypothetical protein